ncbi:MAG: ATP-binding protein, partial [Acidobacteriota bacterium]|nr:ATP-binding protein [Acidobacteriota bacterium]
MEYSETGSDRNPLGSPSPAIPWTGLLTDPVVRLVAIVLAIVALLALVPSLAQVPVLSHLADHADLFLLALAMIAFGYGAERIDHPEGQRFLRYLSLAFFVWLVIHLSYILLPAAPGTLIGDVGGDLLYLLFYFLIILAIESRPHRNPGWSERDPTHRVQVLCAAVVAITMLGYFVIIPSAFSYEVYTSWAPSLYMYVALDVYILFRFLHFASLCRVPICRTVYGLMAAVAAIWTVFDLVETLEYTGAIEILENRAIDLFWWLPYPLVVIAARAPHYIAKNSGADESVADLEARATGTLRAIAPQVALAFLLPALHLGLYGAGLFDATTRAPRDVVILASLVVLGGLVLIQQFRLEKRNRILLGEIREINDQLEESQRMEAIGRLAGGVAHDFNNLLTAIIGHTNLLLDRVSPDDSTRSDIEQIDRASRRAATLTKQLLAFGRRQMLQPVVLDLNAIIIDMQQMVERLIGEHIELVTRLEPGLGRVKADPGQIEQVVLNLALNARDAMPSGGRLTIETGNRAGSDDNGPQIVLTVSDTGSGMDDETRERVFEPFFTTKEHGRGTGLGLSTVYGVVKQSGGQIALETRTGAGTTFRIFLPRFEEEASTVTSEPSTSSPPRSETGGETILLVEDEDSVRELAREILELNGYVVLEAGNGRDALGVLETRDEPVDLLMTDVVMPVMGGTALA